jgi:hypothetical protein
MPCYGLLLAENHLSGSRVHPLDWGKKPAMKRLLVISLLVTTFASSCAPYTTQPATLLRMQSAAAAVEKQGLAVGVTPYLDTERSKATFGGDLKEAGILPLQILIRNNSAYPLTIRKSDFTLQLPGKADYSPVPVAAISDRLESYESSAGVVGSTILFGLAGYLLSSTERDKANQARRADLRNKEMQDRSLNIQESVQGFLFFLIPDDVQEIKD